jgi:hypothetical protein
MWNLYYKLYVAHGHEVRRSLGIRLFSKHVMVFWLWKIYMRVLAGLCVLGITRISPETESDGLGGCKPWDEEPWISRVFLRDEGISQPWHSWRHVTEIAVANTCWQVR